MSNTSSNGFTLIELLIVMVIIAILSALAIPQAGLTRDRAVLGSMKSDLRNLAAAQEAYYSSNFQYTANLNDLNGYLSPSENVVLTIDSATATGWGGKAVHPSVAEVCHVAVGSTRTVSPSCTLP